MIGSWQTTLDELGITGPKDGEEEEQGEMEFGDGSDYGALTNDDIGSMILASGFGNLYKYEVSYKGKVKATKYAIPVIDKNRKIKAWRGDTPEKVIRDFEYGVEKAGDTETTFTDLKQADKYLEEGHGSFKQQRWHVTKLWDLGPVSKRAPPAQVSSPEIQKVTGGEDIVAAAQKAATAGETAKEIAAMEKALSPTEWLKTGKNAVYIIAGVGAVVVVGGIIIFLARRSPAGQAGEAAGGLISGLRRRD